MGYKVEKASDIIQVLKRVFSEDGPVIVECRVNYKGNFRLSERLKAFKNSKDSIKVCLYNPQCPHQSTAKAILEDYSKVLPRNALLSKEKGK